MSVKNLLGWLLAVVPLSSCKEAEELPIAEIQAETATASTTEAAASAAAAAFSETLQPVAPAPTTTPAESPWSTDPHPLQIEMKGDFSYEPAF